MAVSYVWERAGEQYASFECDECHRQIGEDGEVSIEEPRELVPLVLDALCRECLRH